ncbi:putative membrane protein YfcA [Rhodococcus percolatus]|nr:putative membrane protein YfcA [Rhodococcus opacus]MBP2209054.1 putative membrane protein YfcA [Rhodococcus opacus]
MPVAIGTSLVIIVANSAAGLLSHLSGASIDWAITVAFAGTAIAGSLIAGHFGTKVDTDWLPRWFAYLVFVVVAAYVLIDIIFLR